MLRWIKNALRASAVRSGSRSAPERIDDRLGEAAAARRSGDLSRAEDLYRELLEGDPDHAEALFGLGEIATLGGHNEDAAGLIRRAISLEGSRAQYYFGLGCALHALADHAGAAQAYRDALRLDPAHVAAHMNLGAILQEQAEVAASGTQQLDEAVSHFRAVRDLVPGNAEAWMNLGYAMARQRRLDEALQCYDRSLELDPQLAEARFNRSMVLLAQGRFADGWREYEWRWQASGFSRPQYAQAEWDGAALASRAILLYTEQGFGDAIQFVRYAPLLHARGAHVILRSTPELRRLFAGIDGIARSLVSGEALPAFDTHCSLLSLPRLLDLGEIPAEVPYIRADPALVEKWQREISTGPELKVGLVWASQPMARTAPLKSISFEEFAPLLGVPGVKYYSLQKGEAPPRVAGLTDLGGRLEDFAETAAVIANLDLTISVDTAVAHLAGAMGKPVWTLLPFVPDWRWHPDGDTSRWYPGMRLYRQPQRGNWGPLLAAASADLQRLRAARAGVSPT